mmetsp:Transcript_2797/g.7757  ORF Transcript_2797/g.7757 Transcript_2797/m.7757 type:complete len:139 (-) Transcript_2797:297-713(-)
MFRRIHDGIGTRWLRECVRSLHARSNDATERLLPSDSSHLSCASLPSTERSDFRVVRTCLHSSVTGAPHEVGPPPNVIGYSRISMVENRTLFTVFDFWGGTKDDACSGATGHGLGGSSCNPDTFPEASWQGICVEECA